MSARVLATVFTAWLLSACLLVQADGPPTHEPQYQGKKVTQWAADIRSDVWQTRYDAASALRTLGAKAKAAVPLLIKALEDTNPEVRDAAAVGLGDIGPAAAAAGSALVSTALNDRYSYVREHADAALGKIGKIPPDAVRILTKGLNAADPDLCERAITRLGGLGPAAKAALPALTRLRQGSDLVLADAAARACEQIRSPSDNGRPRTPGPWQPAPSSSTEPNQAAQSANDLAASTTLHPNPLPKRAVLGAVPADLSGQRLLADLMAHRGSPAQARSGRRPTIICGSISPDGRTLATGCLDGTIRLWDLARAQEQRIFRGHTFPVDDVVFRSDSTQLASHAVDGTIKTWDVVKGKEKASLKLPVEAPRANRIRTRSLFSSSGFLAFLQDGRPLAYEFTRDAVTLWDVASGKARKPFAAADLVCITPDGKTVVVVRGPEPNFMGGDSTFFEVAWVDAETGKDRAATGFKTVDEILVNPACATPDASKVIVAEGNGQWRLYDVRTAKKGGTIALDSQTGWVTTYSLGLVGGMVAVYANRILPFASNTGASTIELWDLTARKRRAKFRYDAGAPFLRGLTLSRDAKALALTNFDIHGPVIVYNVASGRETAELSLPRPPSAPAVFTPDGKTLITFDGTATLWDITTRH